MSVMQATTVIRLEADCTAGVPCAAFAERTLEQLVNYNRGASMLTLTHGWELAHRTARKRAARAERLGYRFLRFDRSERTREVLEINLSAPVRQGRPMAESYSREWDYAPESVWCPRHHVYSYGVEDNDDRLRAYAFIYRVGEIAVVSTILGDWDRLEDGIMYLLGAGIIKEQVELDGCLFYNLHDSGTEGLRFYKERMGFAATDVEWRL